ncbi:MAG: nucleotide pyrophosphohydrolase [Sphaerochaetaceae bacterium]|jgi:NTP pyrophosphatase (non-canonical NTP hydrolase)|nr:nucleotide pyrophosphohydrolase [Bacteroidales bacterium]
MLDRDIEEDIRKFVRERDWEQFHTPKDLAISISLEAAELLEKFQWSGGDTEVERNREGMKEELADIFMYCFMMADAIGADPKVIIREKLVANRKKYPVSLAYGNARKYTEFQKG